MAFDGNGTFTIVNTFVYDTVISETEVNTNFSDIATGLSNCIAADGQQTITANIPMDGYKFTGIGDGSASDDSTALHQIQDQDGIWCGTAGGTKNALTLTPSPAITAYGTGQKFVFKAGSTASDSTVTIAVSGLTTKAAEFDDAALSASVVIEANKYYEAIYDGTAFQLTRLSAAPVNITATNNGGAAVSSSAVSVDPNNATDTAIAAGDEVLFADASDSNNVKKDTVQGILDLVVSTDQTARDMAASALALILRDTDANQQGAVGPFYLVDDFESDSLTTKTNATYDATGDYYGNPNSTSSASGEWNGSTASFTFSGDDIATSVNDKAIRTNDSFTGDFEFNFTFSSSAGGCRIGLYEIANDASFDQNSATGGVFLGTGVTSQFSLDFTSTTAYDVYGGTSTEATGLTVADADTMQISRSGSTWTLKRNGSTVHTWTKTSSNEVRIALSDSGAGLDYDDISWTDGSAALNMTLAPSAVTIATANPTDLLAYIIIDPQESITAGTDIVMTMSIDGGSTDATGSWTKVGDIGSTGLELWRVEADVSGQTGSSLIYEITTANNKEIRYHDSVGIVPLY